MSRLSILSTLVVVALATIPISANADPCSSKRCVSKIKTLYVKASGTILIKPTDGGQENLNCAAVSDEYLSLPKDTPNFKELYSLLLSATLSKRELRLRVVTGSSDCRISYITLNN